MARIRYIDDPMTANMPLDLDEAAELAAAPPRDLRDPNKLTHLLNRVVLALTSDTEQITRLHTQMAQLQAESRSAGAAPTLDASTMLRYVSDEEIAAAAEAGLRRRIQAVLRDERQVGAALRALRSREAAVRFAVTAALSDPNLDAGTRSNLEAALNAVDAPAPNLSEAREAASNVNEMAAALGMKPNDPMEKPKVAAPAAEPPTPAAEPAAPAPRVASSAPLPARRSEQAGTFRDPVAAAQAAAGGPAVSAAATEPGGETPVRAELTAGPGPLTGERQGVEGHPDSGERRTDDDLAGLFE